MKSCCWFRAIAPWPRMALIAGIPIVALAVLQAILATKPAAGQEPPRPTQRFVSTFPVSAPPAQYELVEQILDFSPGASTRLHQHGGRAFVTVLEGQVVRREREVESAFGPGQTFIEEPGAFHVVSNRGNAKARVFASFLLSPGQQQTLNHPDAPTPSPAPTATFLGRTMLGTQPSEFTLTQLVLDFSPGAYLPRHSHGGQGLIMVIDGEVAFLTDSGQVTRKPREIFRDVEPHDMRNVASGTSATVATFLLRRGEPGTTFATLPTTQPAQSIRPPTTGDAGIASPR